MPQDVSYPYAVTEKILSANNAENDSTTTLAREQVVTGHVEIKTFWED